MGERLPRTGVPPRVTGAEARRDRREACGRCWNGSSTAVSITVTNSGSNDRITVVSTNLGTVATGGNYVGATSTVAGTMSMSGSTVTVALGANPTSPNTVASGTMTWSPSASAKDLAGNAMSTTARTETGAPKQNF